MEVIHMARITKMERRGLDITKLINVFLKWAVVQLGGVPDSRPPPLTYFVILSPPSLDSNIIMIVDHL